jgi:hypothetical protein
MAPTRYNLTLDGGGTYRELFVFRDDAGRRLSLRGYAARMEIRNKVLPNGWLLTQLTTGNGALWLERDVDDEQSTVGTLTMVIPARVTTQLMELLYPALRAVYDLTLIAPNQDFIPVFGGTVSIRTQVTAWQSA